MDRALVKDVLDINVEIGRGSLGLYELDFEQFFFAKALRITILRRHKPDVGGLLS